MLTVPNKIIQKQYAKGMTLQQLARLHETDIETLTPIVQGIEKVARTESDDDEEEWDIDAGGVMVPKRKKPRHHIDHAAYAEPVKRMMDAGMSNTEIMNELNLTNTNLQTIKKKFGLKLTYADGGPRRVARQKRLNQEKEEPTMPVLTKAKLESAVTAFKAEEIPELIGALDEHQKRMERIEQRVLNRDKGVWAEYLTARSEEIENVTHDTDLVTKNGKLIERTTLTYTLEREVGR